MTQVPPEELWPKLEKLGEDEVRRRVMLQVYGARKLPTVQAWLDLKERDRTEAAARVHTQSAADAARAAAGTKTATWVIAWATIALVVVTAIVLLLNR